MNTEFQELVERVADEAAVRTAGKYADLYGYGQEWLDERQAARLLAVSPKTLEKLRSQRRGPDFVRVGRLVRYPRAAVLDWARSQTRGDVA